jgi:proteasome accessory factor B
VPATRPTTAADRADEALQAHVRADKAELREMGVPLETGRTSVLRHRGRLPVARADYELPEIHLTARRRRRGLALRLWESAQLAGAGARAPGQAARPPGSDVDPPGPFPLQPRLDAGEPPSSPATPRPATAGAGVRLPAPRRGRARPPARPAVGRRRLARPLVPGRPRPRPRRRRVFRLSRVVGTPEGDRPAGAFEPPADVDLAAVVAGQVGERSTWSSSAPARHRDRPAPARRPRSGRPTTATTGCSCAPPSRAAGRPARRLRRRRRRSRRRPRCATP